MASRLRRLPKARFICREDITNSMGEHPVYISYSVERKVAKTDTTVWVKREYWNDSRQCVKASHPRHDQLNAMLQVKRHEIDDRLVELNPDIVLTIDLLRKIVKGESVEDADECNRDFVDFALEVMETEYKREKIGISVLDNAKCGLHLFRRFLISSQKRDFLLIREIDERIIDKYIIWRKEQRENSNETINKALTPIFKAVRSAVSLGFLPQSRADKICGRYLPPTKPLLDDDCREEVRYLTHEQMKALMNLYHNVKYDRTRDYIDMFLFSFHTCGMRFVDVLTLQWSNIDFKAGRIKKVLVKSKINHEIPLTTAARQILEKWRGRKGCDRFCLGLLPSTFDLNDEVELKRQRINRNTPIKTSLHEVGRKLELPFSLSFHVARHTFAVLSLNREDNPLSVHVISRLLGHSSLLVTEKVYARFLPSKLEQDLGLDAFSDLTV